VASPLGDSARAYRRASPRLEAYAIIVGAGLVAALALRRPELAIVVAPLALLAALAPALARDPKVEARLSLGAVRSIEGAEVEAEISLRAAWRSVDRLELRLLVPAGLEALDGADLQAVRLQAGEELSVPIVLRCERWGVYELGEIELRARDRLRVVVWEGRAEDLSELKVYPSPETLTGIIAPVETQAFAGSEVSRVKGEGIEYADIRDYVPGDRLRAINWRASARRGSLVVNERHPERNTDVVLFVDSFFDLRGATGSTLDDAVRVAATLAGLYLERRDRVGLVAFGGILRWIQPGMGLTQRYRLIETLLETGVAPDYTWRDVNLIPARILPPKALVVGLTALLDARFSTALADLRARGFDVVAVEVDPLPLVEPGRGAGNDLAYRLWLLEREAMRARLQQLGIGVARWSEDLPLEAALGEVRTYRRHARLARA
jgi:uncharacterized protein (DUF58 family)